MSGDDRAPVPQLSVTLRNFAAEDPSSWEPLVAVAEAADRAGVGRVVVVDHVVFGESLDDYARPEVGGTVGGRQPTGPDGHWLEPLTLLSYVAARTSRVRLATGIMVAALRRPVVLAKSAATLDVLSGGRLDLGVGVGWQRAEYDAAGLDFGARGRLLDESLELCRRLWTEPVVHLDGAGPIHQMPKPRQVGGVPVWVSGRSTNERVRERVARFGAGWIPWGDDAADPTAGIARLREDLAAAGRAADRLQVTAPLPAEPDRVAELVDAGVTDFRLHGAVPGDPAEAEDVLAAAVAFLASAAR
ncbi:MAG: TIGR03619 family F420-dependent LLM class oxidoreductase [Microthrixaceae bacterium]